MTILLRILSGPREGDTVEFREPDTFLFGRSADCHFALRDDPYVSRHHFLIETNPPVCLIRDLGSRNGVLVNERMRLRQVAKRDGISRRGEMYLKHNDEIRVGRTRMRIEVQTSVRCRSCSALFEPMAQAKGSWIGGEFHCRACVDSGWQGSTTPPTPSSREGDSLNQTQTSPPGAPFAPSRRSDSPPQCSGYTLIRKLGEGPYSVVYLATDDATDDDVAIKLVSVRRHDGERTSVKRFLREASITLSLDHPNLVRTIGKASSDEEKNFFFVMEYYSLGSVAGRIRLQGIFTPDETLDIILPVLDGLAYAHGRGFVHRDIKPSNILLGEVDGRIVPRLSDFGLAKNFQQSGLSSYTATGSFGGSWPYVPREQITNFKSVKPVSDIYAMGATIYRMLCGHYVYDFRTGTECIRMILDEPPVPIRTRMPEVPHDLAVVVDTALAIDPADRYPTAEVLKSALLAAGGRS